MQKPVNLADLVTSFPTNIYLQNLGSIQQRTSLMKFAQLAEKSETGSISNLSLIFQPNEQTLQGSFSAVLKPNSASRYSLESSCRDLHNALLCTALESNPKKRGKPWGGKEPGPLHRSSISKFQPKIVNISSRMNNEFPAV